MTRLCRKNWIALHAEFHRLLSVPNEAGDLAPVFLGRDAFRVNVCLLLVRDKMPSPGCVADV